jgi:hypothetical protein
LKTRGRSFLVMRRCTWCTAWLTMMSTQLCQVKSWMSGMRPALVRVPVEGSRGGRPDHEQDSVRANSLVNCRFLNLSPHQNALQSVHCVTNCGYNCRIYVRQRCDITINSYKILSNILHSKLSPFIDEIIEDHQCGFRHNRSTTDQNFCIRQMLEKSWNTMRQYISYS